ncbi:MAG: acetyl-CoA carboxylase biotin carboxyl carrier protein subunit [Lachnospiraceae bacterium]
MKNYTITVNGSVYNVTVEEGAGGSVAAPVAAPAPAAVSAPVAAAPAPAAAAPAAAPAPAAASTGGAGSIKVEAGAAGKIFKIEVSVGQAVKKGDSVVVLEAMKMEIPMVAPQDGVVASIEVAAGDNVESGTVLATLK